MSKFKISFTVTADNMDEAYDVLDSEIRTKIESEDTVASLVTEIEKIKEKKVVKKKFTVKSKSFLSENGFKEWWFYRMGGSTLELFPCTGNDMFDVSMVPKSSDEREYMKTKDGNLIPKKCLKD